MKNKALYMPALFCLCMISCVSPREDDEKILLYMRSQDAYGAGRFNEVISLLKGETKFTPALIIRGKAEYLSGDLSSAEKTLSMALDLKPNDVECMIFLARVYREKGEADEAQKLLDKILGENSMDIRALRLAAELAFDRGVSGEAAASMLLDRAVEASAESALVFLDRARLRWVRGNFEAALDDLSRARVLLPGDSPVIRAVDTLESLIKELGS